MDVTAEQRKLQQEKFNGHLEQLENDNSILELKLSNKGKDFDQLHGKYVNIQVYLNKCKKKQFTKHRNI